MSQFAELINKCLAAGTKKSRSGFKGALTRWVNHRAEQVGAIAARNEALQELSQFDSLPEWLVERFNPKSFYEDGDQVMGWYDTQGQAQAEALPLYHSGRAYYVSFYRRQGKSPYWREKGFEEAIDFPAIRRGDTLNVEFDIQQMSFWVEWGYALPCQIQWTWNDEGLIVNRSILSAGYWCAYRWWVGCKWWYMEKHPEWFEDDPMWGDYGIKPVWHPAPDEFSAVLGGTPVPH